MKTDERSTVRPQGSDPFSLSKLLEKFRLEHDPNIPKLNLRLLKEMWDLTVPFWTRSGAWSSYLIIAMYAAYTFGSAVVWAKIAKFTGDQFDALAKHDANAFYRVMFLAIAAQLGMALFYVVCDLPFEILVLRWREWLTKRFIREYLQNCNYYVLNLDHAVDNPDERMAIDIAQFVAYPTVVLFGVLRSLSNLIVFGYVLWSFAWYLVPVCAVYYVLYSVVTLFLSNPIMNLGYTQRRLDGDFRFSLVNIRVNAEPVAFLAGERVEKRELFHRLGLLIDNFIRNAWWSSVLNGWLSFAASFSTMLPGMLIALLS